MSPGILNERMYTFLATDLVSGELALEPGEQIEPLLLSWDEVLEKLKSREIRDAKTIAALLYYERFYRK